MRSQFILVYFFIFLLLGGNVSATQPRQCGNLKNKKTAIAKEHIPSANHILRSMAAFLKESNLPLAKELGRKLKETIAIRDKDPRQFNVVEAYQSLFTEFYRKVDPKAQLAIRKYFLAHYLKDPLSSSVKKFFAENNIQNHIEVVLGPHPHNRALAEKINALHDPLWSGVGWVFDRQNLLSFQEIFPKVMNQTPRIFFEVTLIVDGYVGVKRSLARAKDYDFASLYYKIRELEREWESEPGGQGVELPFVTDVELWQILHNRKWLRKTTFVYRGEYLTPLEFLKMVKL